MSLLNLKLLKLASCRVVSVLLVCCSFSTLAQAAEELTVAAYGGAYTDMLKKHVVAFESANNCKVLFIPASGAGGLAKAASREADVIHADMAWAYRGDAKKLFEKLDPALVTNLKTLYPKALFSDTGVVTNFSQYGIVYDPGQIKVAPTSWFDLTKPEYKGKISTASFDAANVELLVLFAKLNGGSEDNIDPGFAKMKELTRNVTVFYSQHPQLLDLFRNGDVVMARWLSGRVQWANQQGLNLKFSAPKEGTPALVSSVHVVAGTPHKALAMKFINFLLSKEIQASYASELGYIPARADLDPGSLKVPYGKEVIDSLLIADWKKITPKFEAWKERWDKEMAR